MAGTFDQNATESRWLRGEMPGSYLAPGGNGIPSERMIQIAERAVEVLQRPELSECLSMLEQYNTAQQRKQKKEKKRKRSPFLLGVYLFQVFDSIEGRESTLVRMPALDRPAAELRKRYQEASAKSKVLARLLRKLPQPHIALAALRGKRVAQRLLTPFSIIQSPNKSATTVSLAWLLDRAAASLNALALEKIPRAKQNRSPAKRASEAKQRELRSLAADVLVRAFHDKLGQPYHRHVATIATVLSGINTSPDYVKKLEKRKR
jgi:hypothetical protein